MLKLLPQSEIIIPNSNNPNEVIQYVEKYINDYHCEILNVDISFMNIIDACYVSTMCSTKHFIKYPDGKIKWKVASELIKEFNKDFQLSNCEYYLY